MFKKGKKRPEISTPSNFEHRVHTGFENDRRKPIVDASRITHTDIQPLKVIYKYSATKVISIAHFIIICRDVFTMYNAVYRYRMYILM